MDMILHNTKIMGLKRILLFASLDSLQVKIRNNIIEDDFIPIDCGYHVVGRVRFELSASVI